MPKIARPSSEGCCNSGDILSRKAQPTVQATFASNYFNSISYMYIFYIFSSVVFSCLNWNHCSCDFFFIPVIISFNISISTVNECRFLGIYQNAARRLNDETKAYANYVLMPMAYWRWQQQWRTYTRVPKFLSRKYNLSMLC